MPPPIIKITVKMERKAASILFIPHDSNFFVNGNSIKDISKAKPKGIRIDLAKIKIAKSANTVAKA